MILADATEAIYQQFLTGWAMAQPDVPVATDNDSFQPPDDPEAGAWVRLTVRNDATVQETMAVFGQARVRTRGTVYVSIFTPRDSGRKLADDLVASVKALLQRRVLTRGTTVGNANQVLLYATTPREVGNYGNGPWFLVNCETPFMFDEIA